MLQDSRPCVICMMTHAIHAAERARDGAMPEVTATLLSVMVDIVYRLDRLAMSNNTALIKWQRHFDRILRYEGPTCGHRTPETVDKSLDTDTPPF